MHGLGNDFIVFDAPAGRLPAGAEQLARARRPPHRHRLRPGPGARSSRRRADTAVFYRIFNADGDRGRAVRQRCALHRRPAPPPRAAPRRRHHAWTARPGWSMRACCRRERVSVDMGVPNFEPRALPFDASSEAHVYPLEVAGTDGARSAPSRWAIRTRCSRCRRSTPRRWTDSGPAIEHHPRFPKRVNVGFMEIVDRTHIRLRVYERGAGETLRCGTGACAAVAVGRRRGPARRARYTCACAAASCA